MVSHTNFFENIKEINMRIQGTVVLYNGSPHYVYCVTDHKSDGIFRVYMEPIPDNPNDLLEYRAKHVPYCDEYSTELIGKSMDKYLSETKNTKIIRKMANSPAFNKFRPFPLGFVNDPIRGKAIFTERNPTRHTQQGLCDNMISPKDLPMLTTPVKTRLTRGYNIKSDGSVTVASSFCSPFMKATIENKYPSLELSLTMIQKPEFSSIAFSRNFALLKGPVSSTFLCYKEDIVGLVNPDTKEAKLSKDFKYLKELTEELNTFTKVEME